MEARRPEVESEPREVTPPPKPRYPWSVRLGVTSLGSLAIGIGSLIAGIRVPILGVVGPFCLIAGVLIGLAAGCTALLGLARPSEGRHALPNLIVFLYGLVIVLLTYVSLFTRGRQLRRRGRPLLPRLRPEGGWDHLPTPVAADSSTRTALAAQWRENGRTEHASVAAFARLSLDLLALGAPPDLVASASRDALDEIRHAELCFSLARSLDGSSTSPAPFPEAQRARTLPRRRTFALAKLAVDSLLDGALYEGVSARVVAKLARRCEDPAICDVLREIAADEWRHAKHGWDVVDWCLAEGGTPVRFALAGALAAMPKAMRSPLPAAAEDGSWERYGIHGHALEAEEFQRTRAEVVRRVRKTARLAAPVGSAC